MSLMKSIRRVIIGRKLKSLDRQMQSYKDFAVKSGPQMAEYEKRIARKRNELQARANELYANATPEILFGFLVQFSAIGYHMTIGVPDWFRRAGDACVQKGFREIGEDLIHHSAEEDGHHLWCESDLKCLAQWQQGQSGHLMDWKMILDQSVAPCVLQYRTLHNRVIASPRPFAWLAIKYEIELLSLALGPQFIGKCVEELGFGVLKGLSFVNQHAVADIAHLQDDIEGMGTVLSGSEESLELMIQTAEQAIECYARFFEEAFARASHGVASTPKSKAA